MLGFALLLPSGPIRSGLSASAYASNRGPVEPPAAGAVAAAWCVECVRGGSEREERAERARACGAPERDVSKHATHAPKRAHLGRALGARGHGWGVRRVECRSRIQVVRPARVFLERRERDNPRSEGMERG